MKHSIEELKDINIRESNKHLPQLGPPQKKSSKYLQGFNQPLKKSAVNPNQSEEDIQTKKLSRNRGDEMYELYNDVELEDLEIAEIIQRFEKNLDSLKKMKDLNKKDIDKIKEKQDNLIAPSEKPEDVKLNSKELDGISNDELEIKMSRDYELSSKIKSLEELINSLKNTLNIELQLKTKDEELVALKKKHRDSNMRSIYLLNNVIFVII